MYLYWKRQPTAHAGRQMSGWRAAYSRSPRRDTHVLQVAAPECWWQQETGSWCSAGGSMNWRQRNPMENGLLYAPATAQCPPAAGMHCAPGASSRTTAARCLVSYLHCYKSLDTIRGIRSVGHNAIMDACCRQYTALTTLSWVWQRWTGSISDRRTGCLSTAGR